MASDPNQRPQSAVERHERMQRVRVGVTGLAAIILVVALATAIATGVRRNTPPEKPLTGPALTQNAKIEGDNVIDPRAEPLAQMGVAPGATGDSKGVTVPPAKRPN